MPGVPGQTAAVLRSGVQRPLTGHWRSFCDIKESKSMTMTAINCHKKALLYVKMNMTSPRDLGGLATVASVHMLTSETIAFIIRT